MARIWVAVVNISPRVAQKIAGRHDIEPDEVRQALIGVSGLRFAGMTTSSAAGES